MKNVASVVGSNVNVSCHADRNSLVILSKIDVVENSMIPRIPSTSIVYMKAVNSSTRYCDVSKCIVSIAFFNISLSEAGTYTCTSSNSNRSVFDFVVFGKQCSVCISSTAAVSFVTLSVIF